jgi:hypothetical protein
VQSIKPAGEMELDLYQKSRPAGGTYFFYLDGDMSWPNAGGSTRTIPIG